MKEGYLQHNSQGRYEIPNVTYFTSGEPVQILVDDIWTNGRMEFSHSDGDYYFIADDGTEVHGLTGIKARELN
ncbi:hypothetical protein B0H39_003459 [Clostridium beijerinckii]|uniref:DUF5348 domain-containing protein n=1 Tax=Clostridium beijerinckii TaxID=1520 RepID=UPI0014940E6E|nr:DUF5348 domain-containing protein [Clostridium beijerinckii]NOW85578.1 hypothetical protein [Clostridium beijerinckii]